MLSDRLAATLKRRNIHYGWVVAATTFLTMLVTAGAVGAPGVFILPLQREFGWQTSDISSALAVRLLLFGLMGPFAALVRLSPMILDPAAAVEADIFVAQHGKPWRAPTWLKGRRANGNGFVVLRLSNR